jgi:hypothetical protein
MIVLGVSHLNIRSVLSINNFDLMFAESLPGKPLPVLTTFVMEYSTPLAWLACAVSACAFASLFLPRLTVAFYVLGGAAVAAFAEMTVLQEGLLAPLRMILSGIR